MPYFSEAKKVVGLLLLIGIGLWMPACSSPDPGDKKPEAHENILRIDVDAPLVTLDPNAVNGHCASIVFPLLYSYLFVPDHSGTLQPDLATHWQYDPESCTYTITLRDGARFHDGTPVTTADICYSLHQSQNVRPACYKRIQAVRAISDLEFFIRLESNDPQFLQKIWDVEIVSEPGDKQMDYYHAPIGSGPFRFSGRQGEDRVYLTGNPDYHGGRPALAGVLFTYAPDKEKTWTRLLAGQTDIAPNICPGTYERLKPYADQFYFDISVSNRYTILLYNTRDPLFADKRVRRAMACAIDSRYIVDQIFKGQAEPATGPMGVDSPFHSPAATLPPYDPEKALELLHQAGWRFGPEGKYLVKDGRPFSFTLFIAEEYETEKQVARYIQLCFNDIGIQMHIDALPMDQMVYRYFSNDQFQAVLTELHCAQNRPEFLQTIWSPVSSDCAIAGCFYNADVTRLLNQAVNIDEPGRKKALLQQVDTLICDLQPGTFLFHKKFIDAMSKRFDLNHPFEMSTLGIYDLQHARLSGN